MMNSEARKRAAGIAASNPTAPEPTGTVQGAPGAGPEALAARIADRFELIIFVASHAESHLAPEFCTVDCLADAFLGSSWLADHDRQIAERARTEVEQRWMKVAVMRDGEAIREAQEAAFDNGVAVGQAWGRSVNAPYPHNPYRTADKEARRG